MSHEFSELDINNDSDYGWGDTISITSSNYFFVPSIPEWAYSEFDGLLYEGKEYNWNEIDYRLSVDYNSVPEPADAGFVGAVLVGIFVAFCYFKNKKGK
jgi:hypothetical protein